MKNFVEDSLIKIQYKFKTIQHKNKCVPAKHIVCISIEIEEKCGENKR